MGNNWNFSREYGTVSTRLKELRDELKNVKHRMDAFHLSRKWEKPGQNKKYNKQVIDRLAVLNESAKKLDDEIRWMKVLEDFLDKGGHIDNLITTLMATTEDSNLHLSVQEELENDALTIKSVESVWGREIEAKLIKRIDYLQELKELVGFEEMIDDNVDDPDWRLDIPEDDRELLKTMITIRRIENEDKWKKRPMVFHHAAGVKSSTPLPPNPGGSASHEFQMLTTNGVRLKNWNLVVGETPPF